MSFYVKFAIQMCRRLLPVHFDNQSFSTYLAFKVCYMVEGEQTQNDSKNLN